jgi:hypothetical protein
MPKIMYADFSIHGKDVPAFEFKMITLLSAEYDLIKLFIG